MHPDKNDGTPSELFAALATAEPALGAALEAHLAAYGELLPHVLMGDVTRWLTVHGPQPLVLGVLDEAVASGPNGVKAVIYFSFLEPLDPAEPPDSRIIAGLPPRLRAEFAMFHGGRH